MKMIPPYLEQGVKSGAERRLFGELKKVREGEGYFCLHSINLPQHEYKVCGELDFVILSSRGVFVIEVKGGGVSCEDGIWYFEDRWGERHHRSEGPFQQARSGLYSMRDQLLAKIPGRELEDLVMGFGVAFPDCRFSVEGLEWDPELVLDAHRMISGGISGYIKQLENYWHDKFPGRPDQVSPETIKKIVQVLRPSFDLAKSLQVQAEEIDARLVFLTDEQYSRLDIIEHYPRILIEGGAGTGKSFLALEESKRQAASGKKVLLICFSPILAKFLQTRGDTRGVSITSVHDLMLRYVKKYERIPPGYTPGMAITDPWWIRELSPVFERATLHLPGEDLYDVLIVDEGQDILNLNYMAALDRIVKGALAEGTWRIFYDPFNQSAIFGVLDDDVLELVKSYSPIIPRLTINCRNTDPIVAHTKLFTGSDLAAKSTGSGPIVDVNFFSDPKQAAGHLEDFLMSLQQQECSENEITILSPKPWDHSAASLLSPKWKNKIRVLKGSQQDLFPFPGITFSTIAEFKGLENRYIALIDIEDMDSTAAAKASLYVGMTRARIKLWVAISQAVSDHHDEIIRKNSSFLLKGRNIYGS
jgi:hypothetical protein